MYATGPVSRQTVQELMKNRDRMQRSCSLPTAPAGPACDRDIRPGQRPAALRLILLRVLLLTAVVLPQPNLHADAGTRVAAAASLQFVLPEIAAAFHARTGHGLRITYGSSGNFRRQIEQGAPFELFLSADQAYVEALVEQGLTATAGRDYALGKIAAIAPLAGRIRLTPDLAGIAQAIAAGELEHFAIANPEHAPYGRAAREALTALGLWQSLQPYLIRGENASQALQFATSGSSQGGIVPYALALVPAIAANNQVVLLATANHQPLRQRMVLLKPAGPVAREFFAFMGASEAGAILQRFGFDLPSMPAD
ncbi:MAG: molybdate ABC transporter substrate-binding protein [Gammaproteobacteria bacterium]|jgi:molybdate transport system substrate-binding protein|nr:molybdate ABC transporter substrate-binding protein [Gammaproteobacteria bacterium]